MTGHINGLVLTSSWLPILTSSTRRTVASGGFERGWKAGGGKVTSLDSSCNSPHFERPLYGSGKPKEFLFYFLSFFLVIFVQFLWHF